MVAKAKEANRGKLLDMGLSLFMSQGYHGTGLNEVLKAVNIPKGSFYNYYPSKEAFGAAVIAHYIEPFIDLLQSYLNNPELDGLSALQAYFQELIHALDENQFKGGCLLGNLMGEIGDTSELCSVALLEASQRYQDLIAEGLQRAQQEGQVRTDLSAQSMAGLLHDTWQGALLRMKIEQSIKPLELCCGNLLGHYFKA